MKQPAIIRSWWKPCPKCNSNITEEGRAVNRAQAYMDYFHCHNCGYEQTRQNEEIA